MQNRIKKSGERLVKNLRHHPEKIIAPTIAVIAVLIVVSMVSSLFGLIAGWVLSSTILQVLSLLLVGFVVYGALDKGLRTSAWAQYQRGIKNLVHRFIEIDPVGILRDYRAYLYEQLMQMTMQIDALSKQRDALATQIQDNQEKMDDLIEEAKQSGISDHHRELKARQLGRLNESNTKLQVWETAMQSMYTRLLEMYKTTEIALEETKQQIEEKEMEYQAITASRDAMQAASEIILGKSAKRRQFEDAVESLANDVAQKVGQMEQFMDESNKFINQATLQQAMQTADGLALLELPKLPALDLHARQPELVTHGASKKEENHYDALFNEK